MQQAQLKRAEHRFRDFMAITGAGSLQTARLGLRRTF
jgi:hypothetical protein